MFYRTESGELDQFAALTGQTLDPATVPLAAEVAMNIPIYDMDTRAGMLDDPVARQRLMAEWARVLGHSAGVIVLKSAYADTGPIDAASDLFNQIIAREKAENGAKADHFAAAGANDRIWNALQKLCAADPAVFLRYFANPAIAAVCEAWLGPGYQMTAQVNLVRPGGQTQQVHRDYHLGFQTAEVAARFPAHQHALSACMTLQGAVAHCDMPVESGPTQLLPFSQLFPEGYMAYRRPEFRDFFAAQAVQLPLAKGDAVFFNPALFHAAGQNRSTDIHRMANLLQVSSAFGRAMESVDRLGMCKALYPLLQAATDLTAAERDAAIAATAEGYAFPTNLDTDPPTGGLAPESQAALMQRALRDGLSAATVSAELDALAARQRP
ncbi:phytanoyl-CoA dioxygenase family protein [Mesobacterium sp. TK19101]|uniref:Phytanoyl-CoA dioxygenase family protein n=1 Tax=Mesobacterium hydrothermale TaxID=3111907 RepID=A0ABU6HEK6_9RHOB|nr:phytanoyl-CoA dioxygenase family protein [Mesobacterium sp. TK19101]MEC3860290.1 phytanoyl-CoA dioxygenase family protein [Mesobacterium sp. TK19101]